MLRGDRDDGNALMLGGDDARDQVGRTGARVAEHRGHLARRLVEPFGHVHGRRLVAHRNEPDAVPFECG